MEGKSVDAVHFCIGVDCPQLDPPLCLRISANGSELSSAKYQVYSSSEGVFICQKILICLGSGMYYVHGRFYNM